MKINRGREAGTQSERRSETFTGEVWADPVLPSTGNVMINSVFFAPGARTHWHRHEAGQILVVTSGQGRVYSRDGKAGRSGSATRSTSLPERNTGTAQTPGVTWFTLPSLSARANGSSR